MRDGSYVEVFRSVMSVMMSFWILFMSVGSVGLWFVDDVGLIVCERLR